MKDKDFGVENCWTCKHCILDIEVNKYICIIKGQSLCNKSKPHNIFKPSDCKSYNK